MSFRKSFLASSWRLALLATITAFGVAVSPLGAQPPAAGSEEVHVRFEIQYQPYFAAREEPWDLYVYLDGDLLAWAHKGGQFAPTPPDRFWRKLSPGPHLIRLLVEKHERRGTEWAHDAKAAPFQLFFRLEPGGTGEVILRFIEEQVLLKSESHPISAVVRQRGQLLQNLDQGGTPPSLWPDLCEEIETWLDDRGKGPRKILRKLDRCVRWESLWPGVEAVPPRQEIRALLERYAYTPRTYKRFE